MSYESWLPDWISGSTGVNFYLNLAYFGYNVFYLLSIIYFVFKLGQSYFIYQKKLGTSMDFHIFEMKQEMMEPVRGLVYLLTGMTVIKITVGLFGLSAKVPIDDNVSSMDQVITVFEAAGVWGSLTRVLNIFINVFGFGMASYSSVKALIEYINSRKEDNPSQITMKKQRSVQYLIYAGIAASAVLVTNIVFSLLGISVFGSFR